MPLNTIDVRKLVRSLWENASERNVVLALCTFNICELVRLSGHGGRVLQKGTLPIDPHS